jgi:hypothetical protein
LCRLALVAALGFVLLIPLQLASSWGSLNLLANGQNQQRLQGLAVIGQLRQAISTASSHQDLASRLASLPRPQSGSGSAADLALPFPQRQRNLLEGGPQASRPVALMASSEQQAAALVDQYNAAKRPMSLVEAHQARLAAEAKAAKEVEAAVAATAALENLQLEVFSLQPFTLGTACF